MFLEVHSQRRYNCQPPMLHIKTPHHALETSVLLLDNSLLLSFLQHTLYLSQSFCHENYYTGNSNFFRRYRIAVRRSSAVVIHFQVNLPGLFLSFAPSMIMPLICRPSE
jgi:hypothetical protein